MTTIKTNLTKEVLIKLEKHLQDFSYGDSPKELYEPISYIMSLGGKRIRPLLTLLAYSLYKEDYQNSLTPAMAVEVFHNFTLMHDDIMDEAPLRRGKETVHEKWDTNTAILSGDVMLVKAYEILSEVPADKLGDCLRLFNKTAREVCEGQQRDMNFETMGEVAESEYLEMIRQKTAVLLGFALQFGAILAGASKEDSQHLYDFGVNIGIGFQLKDDLLDVYADKEKFGKQVGGDIIANKKTFLLIKARELAKEEDKDRLEGWLSKTDFDKDQKVKEVTSLYNKLGIKNITEAKMTSYFDLGFAQLDDLNISNKEMLAALKGLTQDLIDREQ